MNKGNIPLDAQYFIEVISEKGIGNKQYLNIE